VVGRLSMHLRTRHGPVDQTSRVMRSRPILPIVRPANGPLGVGVRRMHNNHASSAANVVPLTYYGIAIGLWSVTLLSIISTEEGKQYLMRQHAKHFPPKKRCAIMNYPENQEQHVPPSAVKAAMQMFSDNETIAIVGLPGISKFACANTILKKFPDSSMPTHYCLDAHFMRHFKRDVLCFAKALEIKGAYTHDLLREIVRQLGKRDKAKLVIKCVTTETLADVIFFMSLLESTDAKLVLTSGCDEVCLALSAKGVPLLRIGDCLRPCDFPTYPENDPYLSAILQEIKGDVSVYAPLLYLITHCYREEDYMQRLKRRTLNYQATIVHDALHAARDSLSCPCDLDEVMTVFSWIAPADSQKQCAIERGELEQKFYRFFPCADRDEAQYRVLAIIQALLTVGLISMDPYPCDLLWPKCPLVVQQQASYRNSPIPDPLPPPAGSFPYRHLFLAKGLSDSA
jgi:hypothetical protein